MKKLLAFISGIIILSAMIIATQYTGKKFNYPDHGLNIEVGEKRIYAPWQLIVWGRANHLSGDPYVKDVFKNATNILFLACAICVVLFAGILRNNKKKNTYSQGAASWMTDEEMRGSQYCAKTEDETPDGIIMGQLSSGAKIKMVGETVMKLLKKSFLLVDKSLTHLALFASTRWGKGVSLVINTLIAWKQSFFCYDIKRENYEKTAGYKSLTHTVLKFDPSSEDSVKWNPFNEIRLGTVNEVSDVQMISEMLMNTDGDKQASDIWFALSKKLCSGVILYLIHSNEKDKSISGMYNILSSKDSVVDKLNEMVNFDTGKTETNLIIQSYLYEFIEMAKSEKQFAGAISSTLQSLELYLDPVVKKNTSTSDFKVDDLMGSKRPVAFYYCVPPSNEVRLRSLTRLFITCCLTMTMETLTPKKHKLLMMIDEFPSLGKLPIVEKAMAYTAGYGIKMCLISQSLNQLYSLYGEKTSIMGNAQIQIYYTATETQVAKEISTRLGRTTVLVDSVSSSGQRDEMINKGMSTSTSETGKDLMPIDEIMTLPYENAIICIAGKKPYLAKKAVYYDDPRFANKTKIPPPKLDNGFEYLASYDPNYRHYTTSIVQNEIQEEKTRIEEEADLETAEHDADNEANNTVENENDENENNFQEDSYDDFGAKYSMNAFSSKATEKLMKKAYRSKK